jgi:hypothetical protein
VSVLLQVLNTVSSQPGLPPTAEPIIQYAVDEVGDRITARGSGATA